MTPPSDVAVFARTHVPPGVLKRQIPSGCVAYPGLQFSTPEGFRPLEMDVFVPADVDAAPCVVWIHGGAFMFGSRRHPPTEWPAGLLFKKLIDAGLAVASIDYRHARESPFPAQLHDAKASVRYLRAFAVELGIDPERIAVWGESAGGQLASLVGMVREDAELEGTEGVSPGRSDVAAVVDFYGTSDIATVGSMIDKMPAHVRAALERSGRPIVEPLNVLVEGSPLRDARAAASPVSHVAEGAPPFLIVHGEDDRGVPISQSEELVAALERCGVPVEFVRVPGAGHVFGGVDPEPQLDVAVTFLRHQLTTA